MLFINSIKPVDHDLKNICSENSISIQSLDMSFMTRIVSSARMILLPTVHRYRTEIWDKIQSFVTFVLNTTKQETTDFMPYPWT